MKPRLFFAMRRRRGGEGARAGALDHGPVGERVRERYPQLDDVRPAARGLDHEAPRVGERWVTGREVGDERAFAARSQPREGLSEPAHPISLPSALATTCTSLSPRP